MAVTTFEKGVEKGRQDAREEAQTMAVTTFEKGKELGAATGLRKALVALLQRQFGKLPQSVLTRLDGLTEPELDSLFTRALDGASLVDLGLLDQE